MRKWLIVVIGLASVSLAEAQFFGGYANGGSGIRVQKGTSGFPPLQIVYDDFTFDVAGDITRLGMVGADYTSLAYGLYWEIRTGVSIEAGGTPWPYGLGNTTGGTLLFSGTLSWPTITPLALDGSAGTPPRLSDYFHPYSLVQGVFPTGSPLHLEAGTYWIGMATVASSGWFNLATTSGQGAVGHPIDNGNAFYYDMFYGGAFISMDTQDFGYRIDTIASTVPEPDILTLLTVAVAGFFIQRRSRC